MPHSVEKTYHDIPFAHRLWRHDGKCRFVHGHNWSFRFRFTSVALDDFGFVVDFGKLKWLKAWLHETFDHALVVESSDPSLPLFRLMAGRFAEMQPLYQEAHDDMVSLSGWLAHLVIVPDASCEGIAELLHARITAKLEDHPDLRARGVTCTSVTVEESSVNRATFTVGFPLVFNDPEKFTPAESLYNQGQGLALESQIQPASTGLDMGAHTDLQTPTTTEDARPRDGYGKQLDDTWDGESNPFE